MPPASASRPKLQELRQLLEHLTHMAASGQRFAAPISLSVRRFAIHGQRPVCQYLGGQPPAARTPGDVQAIKRLPAAARCVLSLP